MAKSSLTYAERNRLEFLTSHLRGTARPSIKAKYEDEIVQLLAGKTLTRGDTALAAYYLNNSGNNADDAGAARDFAAVFRATAGE